MRSGRLLPSETMAHGPRHYADIRLNISGDSSRDERMRRFVDALWEAFGDDEPSKRYPAPFSWVGFYLGPGESFEGTTASAEEMILAHRLNKPACSPIGLHGACGRAYLERGALVVADVARLGEKYIACDPRDRSELVVPLLNEDGAPWGVLDVDSFQTEAFGEHDVWELWRLLMQARLVSEDAPLPSVRLI